jgi:hypothetical protein
MKTNFRIGALAAFASLLLGLAGCVLRPAWRGDEGTAYDVLNRSTIALLEIDRDALAGPFGSEMRHACAVFVFPGHVKGVATSAATRGDGVLLVRDRSTGHWNGPAFSLAYYQASAPLAAIMVDRSVHNDASGEILATVESVANRGPAGRPD